MVPKKVNLPIRLFVRVFVCSIFEAPFKHHFAPTSRNRMSKILIDSESLGKSKDCKIAALIFFGEFCHTHRIFLLSVLLSASVDRCFVSRMRVFSSPFHKVVELQELFGGGSVHNGAYPVLFKCKAEVCTTDIIRICGLSKGF